MRRYLHQGGGYATTGDTSEHKLWFHWGQGRNGKSTTIDSWCSALGDYSATIGIESFLDQGIKKRGDAATPDLAKLGGIRMLRASEPSRDAKLDSALIKAVTGGEPMSVRALHRGFFDLMPRFKLHISGNTRPSIPDTDDGIWSRLKLVPWLRNIEKPEPGVENWPTKDKHLLDKIKAAELPGVFNRLVAGLCDWLENGFVEPQRVTEATQAYRDNSDPLARFLRLCVEPDPDGRVQSSHLHRVFVAWSKAAGEQGIASGATRAFRTRWSRRATRRSKATGCGGSASS
jgi:putative DNA primase/helicase